MLARQGRGVAGREDPGRPGLGFWRRRQRAEADARETLTAAREADERLSEALAGKAAAEQEAAAAHEQVAAARQERDDAVAAAESRAVQVADADRDMTAGRQPRSTTCRSRHPRGK
jgi:hypothetical protein